MAFKAADVFVLVGGDLTPYRKSLKDAEKEALSLGQRIRNALNTGNLGTSKDPVFSNLGNIKSFVKDLQTGRVGLSGLRDQAIRAGGSLKTAFSSATLSVFHKGLGGIKTILGGLKGVAGDIFKGFSIGLGIGSFQALGRVLSDVVNFIPDLIAKGRDYGRIVDDIADATGATTEQTSKFASTLLFLGVPLNGVINMVGQMSRNLDEQGPILERLGVATHDQSGALLNQIQILDNARKAMVNWGLGTTQANQIAREFGRGGLKTLVDYLHLTDEQFARVTEDARASGLILTDAQRDLGESMIREEARFQNALTGLGVTIFTVVGPQIRAFFSQLTDFIQTHVTEISNAISNAISFILGLVGSLVGASASLDSFAGSIQAANKVQSPYASHITDLAVELAKLEEQQDKTTDSTQAQRDAIQDQIKAIDLQIAALRRQEAAEDTVFKRTLANLAKVYQARLDNLDLAERERENLLRQRDLNEQLNEAQIDLLAAQRGSAKGGGIEIDAEEVSNAMARVAEIQRDQAELLRDNVIAGQRGALEATRDYIESIGELLEKADNKQAALNTLRRREDVLANRLATQQAAGDTEGAADTQARLEAVKTAAVRAEEQVRNGARETALDRQKDMLQEELSNVRSVAVNTTAIRKAEIEKQIQDLIKQDAAWERLTDKQKAELIGVTDTINGPGGLTAAMVEAREEGVKLGDSMKEWLGDVGDLFGGIVGFLGDIKDALTEIGNSDVWKLLTKPVGFGPGETFGSPGGQIQGPPTPRQPLINQLPDWLLGIGRTFTPTSSGNTFDPDDIPDRRMGGYTNNEGPYWLHDREYVIDRSLTEDLKQYFARGRMTGPAMAPALAGAGGVIPHSHDIVIDGKRVAETQLPHIERHLADSRRG